MLYNYYNFSLCLKLYQHEKSTHSYSFKTVCIVVCLCTHTFMPFTSLAIIFLMPLFACNSVNVFICVHTVKPRSYYTVTFHMEHDEGHRATFVPEGKSVHFLRSGSYIRSLFHNAVFIIKTTWRIELNQWGLERKCQEVTRPEKTVPVFVSSIHPEMHRTQHLRMCLQVGGCCRFPARKWRMLGGTRVWL